MPSLYLVLNPTSVWWTNMQRILQRRPDTNLLFSNLGLFAAHIHYQGPVGLVQKSWQWLFWLTGYPANREIIPTKIQARRCAHAIEKLGDWDDETDMFIIIDEAETVDAQTRTAIEKEINQMVGPMIQVNMYIDLASLIGTGSSESGLCYLAADLKQIVEDAVVFFVNEKTRIAQPLLVARPNANKSSIEVIHSSALQHETTEAAALSPDPDQE